jgi:hypothetical protein
MNVVMRKLRYTGTTEPAARRILDAVGNAKFQPFTDADYKTFCGVESSDPRIAEADGFLLVSDMNKVEVLNGDGNMVGLVTFEHTIKVKVLR